MITLARSMDLDTHVFHILGFSISLLYQYPSLLAAYWIQHFRVYD